MHKNSKNSKNSARDSQIIETINLYQSHEKVYTQAFFGFFRNLRIAGGALLFLLYFGSPWLTWNGRQAVLWDLSTRQFHIFGSTFLPQDFMLLTGVLVIAAFALFFITVLAGRVWCGFACPQSVFTWVFLWIERQTEGDRNRRIRLDTSAISSEKILRKTAKHMFWLIVALVTGCTFVGYFTPIRTLIPDLISANASLGALFWVVFFTLATYINAGWMREQVCIYMCPYARFQSVMYDKNTLAVHYHASRGEPRGARNRQANPESDVLGQCIDCQLCVHVCPTGIDIRQGLQYECISCGACVDACNSVMDKMDYPRGLIAYTSENALTGHTTQYIRPRLIGYGLVLISVKALFIVSLVQRPLFELEVLRDRQSLYQYNHNGNIDNVYTLKLVSKTAQAEKIALSVSGLPNATILGPTTYTLIPGVVASIPVRLTAPAKALDHTTRKIVFHITRTDDKDIVASGESRFLSPTPPSADML